MRIGYLTYGLDRAPTGIGRYAVELLRALQRVAGGPEIVVLATEREDTHGLRDAFEYHRLPAGRTLPSVMSIGSLLLPVFAHRHHLDAIHDPNGIAPFIGGQRRVKRICTLHDAFAYVYPKEHNLADNWRYRWHLPYALRCADAIVTVSQCSRSDLIKYLHLDPAKVIVTPEGIDQRFTPVTEERKLRTVKERYGVRSPFLLYVGALNARKNIVRLLEAFTMLRSNHPDLSLVLGGKRQWGISEIDQAWQRLDLDGKVTFTGYLDDSDLPALYSAAEAFVFPSLYEGFGLPPLEAMACGAPVVTSNVSSLPEIVGDAAILVDPLDVADLVRALDRVLLDEPLRQSLRTRGFERASQFSWDETARLTGEIYSRVVRSAGLEEIPSESSSREEPEIAI